LASVSNDWIQKIRPIHHAPRPTCTCDLVCLDEAPMANLGAPDTSSGYFRAEPVRQVAFPSPPIQFNPKSRERCRVVFVSPPTKSPSPRSPPPTTPQIWRGTSFDERRSFAQVVAISRMDQRYGGSRRLPPRRSPPRNYSNYFGNCPKKR
jgi:hypothetical protein